MTTNLQTEYRRIREAATYDTGSKPEFDKAAAALVPENPTPEDWVEAAKRVVMDCDACNGTGLYAGDGKGGPCYRCGGKGHQDWHDGARNRCYDNHLRVV